MLIALGIAAALAPFAAVVALLVLADRAQRARRRILERQVRLTDAIHRELGAVAAPVVTRRPLGVWRVALAVPAAQPVLVARLVAIAARELASEARRPAGVEIVLRARAA